MQFSGAEPGEQGAPMEPMLGEEHVSWINKLGAQCGQAGDMGIPGGQILGELSKFCLQEP